MMIRNKRALSILVFQIFFFSLQNTFAFTVEKYSVVVSPEFAKKSIKGSTEIYFSSSEQKILEFPLYGLNVEEVLSNTKPVPFTQSPTKLIVDVSKLKNIKSLLISYNGSPSHGLVWGENYVYTSFNPCTWMICLEDPAVRAPIEIQLTAPKGMKTVANGEEVSQGKWKEVRPYSAYLYGFAMGNFVTVSERVQNVDVQYMGIGGTEEVLKKKFKDTEKIIQFFDDKSGVALPLKKYTQVLVPGTEAQEKQGFSILGSEYVDPIMTNPQEDWVLVHELAHQWWGNLLTCKSWQHFWLNEGLTVFMTAAYKQNRWGQNAYDNEMELAKKRYQRAIDAKFDVPLTYAGEYPNLSLKRAIVYSKGALFLDALRKEIGDLSFWSGIKTYTVRFQLHSVESKDFQKVMEQSAKKSLKSIFEKWVY